MKFHDLHGTRVINVADAQTLGTIDDLFVHLENQRVRALRVKTGGLFGGHKCLLVENVKSIGHDAVTVTQASALEGTDGEPILGRTVGHGAIDGARVLTESGTHVGTVADIDADFTSGAINGYVLRSGVVDRLQHEERLVPATTVKSIGNKTIIVADAVVPA